MPIWLGLYFQDSCSFIMEQLIFFHDHTMMILLVVMLLVGYLLGYFCFGKCYSKSHYSAHILESVWTFVPIFLLMVVVFPSLRLLYLMEEADCSELNIKVVGHQWFWSFEYSDFMMNEIDSYMLNEVHLFRLLEVDWSLFLPVRTMIRVMVTSGDVIHSWTLPSMGVSVDAIPGRLNQIILMFNRLGNIVGQCSEICGLNHSFMPIVVSVVSREGFFLEMEWCVNHKVLIS